MKMADAGTLSTEKGVAMGRITASITIENVFDTASSVSCEALVDIGASYLTLPLAWKSQLGELPNVRSVDLETATQLVVRAEVCGPVTVRIDGFEPVSSEVLFVGMHPEDGEF